MEIEDYGLSEDLLEKVHARTALDRQLYKAMTTQFRRLTSVSWVAGKDCKRVPHLLIHCVYVILDYETGLGSG